MGNTQTTHQKFGSKSIGGLASLIGADKSIFHRTMGLFIDVAIDFIYCGGNPWCVLTGYVTKLVGQAFVTIVTDAFNTLRKDIERTTLRFILHAQQTASLNTPPSALPDIFKPFFDALKQDCDLCEKDNDICVLYKLVLLRATYESNYMAQTDAEKAIKAICTSLPTSDRKREVAHKLLTIGFSPADATNNHKLVSYFLKDVNEKIYPPKLLDELCHRLYLLTPSIIDTWVFVVKAIDRSGIRTDFARDFTLLQKVEEINSNPAMQNAFNNIKTNMSNLSQFMKTYEDVPCNTCGTPSGRSEYFQTMDKILTNTIHGFQNFSSVTGFYSPQTPLGFYQKEPFASFQAVNSRDGGQHMLKVMRDFGLTAAILEGIDEEFPNVDKRYDILIKLGNQMPAHPKVPQNQASQVVFIECKSYEEESELTTTGVEQLIEYLKHPRVTSINNLLYVFNALKLSDTQAKQKMQTVFKNNAPLIFSTNPVLFTSLSIPNETVLFDLANRGLLINHPVLNFVITN